MGLRELYVADTYSLQKRRRSLAAEVKQTTGQTFDPGITRTLAAQSEPIIQHLVKASTSSLCDRVRAHLPSVALSFAHHLAQWTPTLS